MSSGFVHGMSRLASTSMMVFEVPSVISASAEPRLSGEIVRGPVGM